MKWQAAMRVQMRNENGQNHDTRSIEPSGEKLLEEFWQSQFDQRVFDADLPKRGRADKDRVFRVLNPRKRRGTELPARNQSSA